MQEVPNADVVITNPTHYAIALKYKDGDMDAPIVVAKGVDFIAQKIKLIAKEHDIVMVENRPLASQLGKAGRIRAEELFSIERCIDAHEVLYRRSARNAAALQ